MLNYIWLALIVIGVLTAAGRDIYDGVNNTYANEVPWNIDLQGKADKGKRIETVWIFTGEQLNTHFPGAGIDDDCSLDVSLLYTSARKGHVKLVLPEDAPGRLKDIAAAQGNPESITGIVERDESGAAWKLVLDPVSFVFLKRITNAAFDAASLAVTIAIGLIGIMALWLGIVKVAEEAGLVHLIARAVAPLTRRLFPDVPHDHPAIASMIMNIAANMLGLGNAATPFGLKAMEELNEINPKAGTATNAMVTFLALNTSCITLIPATAIAVRAASGSNDPAAIIGTTFLASLTATVVGVTTAKVLQRLRIFRIKEGAV